MSVEAEVALKDVYRSKMRFYGVLVVLLSLLSVELIVIVSLFYRTAHASPPNVDARISELGHIQQSLKELDGYIESQKRSLQGNEAELRHLRTETAETQAVLNLSQKEVKALLAAAGLRELPWYQRFFWQAIALTISFVVGVLSSVTANRYQTFRRVQNASVALAGGLQMRGKVATELRKVTTGDDPKPD